METFSALLALTGEFPAQCPVTRSFGVFSLIYVLDKRFDDLRCHRAHYEVTVMNSCFVMNILTSILTFPGVAQKLTSIRLR